MIKLINILKQIVESKQVGTLYHWTSLPNLISILNQNTIKSNTNPEYQDIDFRNKSNIQPHVSFTRVKGKPPGNDHIFNFECALQIDGNKLSNNYKISPFSMVDNPKILAGKYKIEPLEDEDEDEPYDSSTFQAEYEERIYGDIKNIKSYITQIILDASLIKLNNDEEDIKKYLQYIENTKIPILYTSDQSPVNKKISKTEFYNILYS